MEMVNALVTRPTRAGKRALMMPGMSTFPSATPKPSSTVPPKSPAMPAYERSATPVPIISRPNRSVLPAPKRSLMRQTNGETTANMTGGMVVSSPSTLLGNDTLDLMSGMSGPTAVIGARRLTATQRIAINSRESSFF
ncbi:hypothetical protein SDC9_61627 [bioreactor metagenome]|uniref:Uncharacterized protein n=1 Tax=bioreactor metagenome TaxID=1076179 RepID=A0A644XGM8_9ZZZZ